MGFLGLFGKDKPSEKAIAKQVNHVKEQYAKPDYRQMAMDKLLGWGTKESLQGLLSRFTVVVQSPHWDEEEKRWLVDQLATRGDLAKEVLQEFLLKSSDVTHAIQALSRLCTKAELNTILVQALHVRSPEDYRSSQSKIELIFSLQEHGVPNLESEILPYLDDHNDDVKCTVLNVCMIQKCELAYPRIAQMISEIEHSARVLRQAATIVCQLQIPVDLHKPLAPEVAEDFVVKNGKLKPFHRG
jgi:hypothetical protein